MVTIDLHHTKDGLSFEYSHHFTTSASKYFWILIDIVSFLCLIISVRTMFRIIRVVIFSLICSVRICLTIYLTC